MTLDGFVHLPVEKAKQLAEAQGFDVMVENTAPPRGPIDGEERVVRVKADGQTLVFTTAFYVRAK